MSDETIERTRRPSISVARALLIATYLILAIAGLVGTWYFNLVFMAQPSELSYLEAWFVNPASSSAAIDIIVVAVMGSVFMAVEGWRLRMQWTWVLIPLSFAVALAFTFPLFLAIREVRLHASSSNRIPETSRQR